MVGEAQRLGLGGAVDGRPVDRSIDGRYSSSRTTSIGVVSGRRQRAHSPASDVDEAGIGQDAPIGPCEPDLAGDRRGELEPVGQVDPDIADA